MKLDFHEMHPTADGVLGAINALGTTESILGHGVAELFPLKRDDRIRDAVNAFGFDTQNDLHVSLESLFDCEFSGLRIHNSTLSEVCDAISETAVVRYAQVDSLFAKEDPVLSVYGTLVGTNCSYIALSSNVRYLYASEIGISLVRRGLVHYPHSWQAMVNEIREANRVVGLRSFIFGEYRKAKLAFEGTTLRSICKKIAIEEKSRSGRSE